MLNKGDIAGADKLLESSMKMEKMEWDRKDQGYRALENGMDRARASIKGASDQEAAQAMLMQALMSYPPQLQPLVQGAINDLKKLGFQEWQKKWGDEAGPLGMTQRSIEQRRLVETNRHNEELEKNRQRQIDVQNRRVDALIAKAATGSEDKEEARVDRQTASAASRITSIQRGLERDQSYIKAQADVEKAQRDLDNAGMFTSEAPLKAALERAKEKLEKIEKRNLESQKAIARSQSPQVQERLRESLPDLFETQTPSTPATPTSTTPAPTAVKTDSKATKKTSDDKELTREQVKSRWEEVKKLSQEEQIQFINDNKKYFLPEGIPKNARLAPDGEWYSPDPNRPGKYIKHTVTK
jgi:hypothetical protein